MSHFRNVEIGHIRSTEEPPYSVYYPVLFDFYQDVFGTLAEAMQPMTEEKYAALGRELCQALVDARRKKNLPR